MTFSIDFNVSHDVLQKPANRNWHDPFYWDFAYKLAHDSQQECDAAEEDWQIQKTIHDLYEIYNAPHVAKDERSQRAAEYIVNKQYTLIHENKARYPDYVERTMAERRRERLAASKETEPQIRVSFRPMIETTEVAGDTLSDAELDKATERTLSWRELLD